MFVARFVGERRARAYRQTVDQNRAGAADLDFTRNLRPCEVQLIAQDFGKRRPSSALSASQAYFCGFAV